MAQVTVEGDRLCIRIVGVDRVLALKGELEIPLSHIKGVRANPEEAHRWWKGFRAPGTWIPGVITAGTFYTGDGRVFYDMHDPDKTVEIDLDHEKYSRVIVQVDDPEATVKQIQSTVAG